MRCWTCFLNCLMGTQLLSSFTTIAVVLCCLLPRCRLFDGALAQASCTATAKHFGYGSGRFPVRFSSAMSLTQRSPVSCQTQLWSCLPAGGGLPRYTDLSYPLGGKVQPSAGGQRSGTVAEWLQVLEHTTVMSFGLLCPCRVLLPQAKETPWHLLLSNLTPTEIKHNV